MISLTPIKKGCGATTCIVLVHGTFNRYPRWISGTSALVQAINAAIGEADIFAFRWSACLRQESRFEAAQALMAPLQDFSRRYRDVIVIGHSHGANIAVQAVQASRNDHVRIIALATPFLHVRAVSTAINLRHVIALALSIAMFASVVSCMNLAARFGPWLPLPIAAIIGSYAVAVFTHEAWLAPLCRSLALHLDRRRRLYANLDLHRPIEMLIVQSAPRDEVTYLFGALREAGCRLALRLRRAAIAADAALKRMTQVVPNQYLAMLLAFAVILLLIGAHVIYILTLIDVMLVVLLVNYLTGVFPVSLHLGMLVSKESYAAVVSALKIGHPLDALSISVRISHLPRVHPACTGSITFCEVSPPRSTSFLHRLALWQWDHSMICDNADALTKMSRWIRRPS